MRENALLIVSLFFIFAFLLQLNDAYASLSGFNYKRAIIINNTQNSNNSTDYQVNITLNTASLISEGKMRSDCGDIRFTLPNGTLLSYWLESGCNTTSTVIWVKVPYIPANSNTTIYVYYGNPSATSLSNPYSVFEFYDDFSSDTRSSYITSGTVVYDSTNQRIQVGASSTNTNSGKIQKGTFSTSSIGMEYRVDVYIGQTATGSNKIADLLFHTTSDFSSTAGTGYGVFVWAYDTNNRGFYIFKHTAGFNTRTQLVKGTFVPQTQTWYRVVIRVLPSGSITAQIYTLSDMVLRDTISITDSSYRSGYIGVFNWDDINLVDNIIVRKYTSPEPTTSIGNEESLNHLPTITIFSPLNQTYFYSNNFVFNFSVSDDKSSTFWIRAFLDNNLIYENTSYQNNTIVILTRNLTQIKSYNFTIWANDTDASDPRISIHSVIFTIKDFEIQQITYNTNVYETSQQTFSEVIRYNPDLVSNITANLVWNSSNYQTTQARNTTHFTFTSNIYIPLVQTNNTAVNFYFSNQIAYLNGTMATINSPTNQQNILFAYVPTNLSVPTNVIEMDFIPVSFSPTYYSTNADLEAYVYFRNQTVQLTPRSYAHFTGLIDALNATNYNETYPIYASLVISFNNQTVTRSSNQTNITVYKVTLTDCSIFPTQTFQLIVRDEETGTNLTSLNYTFLRFDVTPLNNRITRTYTFENKQNICIYPSWVTYNAKIYAIVRKDNYALTTHAPYTTSVLSNQTQTLTLYMLPSSYATPITFTLPDQNYILYVERGYGANFVYIRSDSADFNKKVVIYLRPYDVYYKVKVFTPEQTLCFQSDQFKVASSAYEILSCQAGLVNYTITPMYQKIISGNCSTFDLGNYTRVLCSFVTLDNLDHEVNLTVYKLVEPFGEIVYYKNSTRASTGSFDVLLEKGYDYRVVMSAHSIFDYITFNIYSKVLQKSAEVFALALILFTVSAVVGFINPFAGLTMNVLILLGLSGMGVLTLQAGVIGVLTLLIIVTIIFTREWR